MKKKLKYAMVGGSKGSFIGPIHRIALRMDNLAYLVAGCFPGPREGVRTMRFVEASLKSAANGNVWVNV